MSQKDFFNRGGMLFFAVSMVVTLGFFAYVMVINPGPLDTGVFEVPIQFSKAQTDERTTTWKQITPETTAYGEKLYEVNCAQCHSTTGQDAVKVRFQQGQTKYGSKPLQVYSVVRKGFNQEHRFDYLPEREKWAMITYLRSLQSNAPDDESSDWKKFLQEGLY